MARGWHGRRTRRGSAWRQQLSTRPEGGPLDGVSLLLHGSSMIRAMMTLAEDLVPDELWALVAPLLPVPPRPPYGGRRRAIPDRNCFAAIIYIARTSTSWRLLPARELGCGSPASCWRRFTEWANAGVFEQLHLQVLDRLGEQGRLDWDRASVDTMSVRARRGGTMWAQIPSIVASLEASCIWSATVASCR